ncbi:hypothetical protein C7M84_007858 [Penaeus vannamei]|uniref:Gustatory receptor n=1 Tax=Penaeus vannamei TaxID=6689 RepID=A0A3R7PJC2_PENVA|nr:hypothetical protein C7M84_007858 [Penaeus vannamei]
MRTLFSLRLLLGFSRLLGCFPYAVKLNPPKITFKKYLLAYSVVFIAFTITCVAYLLSTGLPLVFQSGFTVKNITYFVQMMSMVYPVFLYLYSILRIRRLKDIVQWILHSQVHQHRSLPKTFDWLSLVYLMATCATCVYTCIDDLSLADTYYVAMIVAYNLLILPVFSQPIVLYNALLRLITLYLKATFAPVDEALLSETPVFLVKTKADSHGCKSSEEVHHSPSVSVMERLRSVRLGLCDLDQLLRDVNDHFGPLLCVCLASDQLFVITFLQDLISSRNYSIFVSLIVVLLAFMRILLLMNSPRMFIREDFPYNYVSPASPPHQLDEIEHDLANCPKFEVCGLFEIGRQSLLPMFTFTLSYLLLMAQFVMSEK